MHFHGNPKEDHIFRKIKGFHSLKANVGKHTNNNEDKMSRNSTSIIQMLINKTWWFEMFNPNVSKIFTIQNRSHTNYEML